MPTQAPASVRTSYAVELIRPRRLKLKPRPGAALCANVRETSTRSEISVEGAMDLQDEEINQGSVDA